MHVFCLLHIAETKNKTSMSSFVSSSHEKDQFVKTLISLTTVIKGWCFSILGRSYSGFPFLSKENFG